MSPTVLWLLAGAVFIGIDIFGMPGIGFLFAGIAALMVGSAIEFAVLGDDQLIAQFALFFLITSISAALLWTRLKNAHRPSYSNILGSEAVVAAPGLSGGAEGQVKWSGTLMRARLAEGAEADRLPEGTVVVIRQVEGNLLFVARKP
ncbi:MAG: NfeD family protein [Alphaproteobacteria bacterium]|nr:NfeD family protein [Alphaproteobacteria bacterium]